MTETYLYVRVPGCPIAPSDDGLMPLHRLVLYAKIGPGPHPCFRCEAPVDWGLDLVVNHMDRNTRNNAWDNLVPACQGCNIAHGNDPRFESGPFLMKGSKRVRAVERVCQRTSCQKIFLYPLAQFEHRQRLGKPAGLYCSTECMYARNR